jgi:hypothetical protein
MGLISSFIIIALLILLQLTSAAEAKRREMLSSAVPRAVEIAKLQGWVSPRRLMAQASLKKRAARRVLLEACRQGRLYRAVNGRFYVNQVYSTSHNSIIAKAAKDVLVSFSQTDFSKVKRQAHIGQADLRISVRPGQGDLC